MKNTNEMLPAVITKKNQVKWFSLGFVLGPIGVLFAWIDGKRKKLDKYLIEKQAKPAMYGFLAGAGFGHLIPIVKENPSNIVWLGIGAIDFLIVGFVVYKIAEAKVLRKMRKEGKLPPSFR